MIAGTIYGVVLNDSEELNALGAELEAKPYNAPPVAPVVYARPLTCVSRGVVRVPAGAELLAAATVGLLFGRDSSTCAPLDAVAAACLALDMMTPTASYYRPPIVQRNADGSLPLGDFAAPGIPQEIRTLVDGRPVHSWTLDRLVRSAETLIGELTRFMTLRAGDLLMIGLPGDAPIVTAGRKITVEANGLPTLSTIVMEQEA